MPRYDTNTAVDLAPLLEPLLAEFKTRAAEILRAANMAETLPDIRASVFTIEVQMSWGDWAKPTVIKKANVTLTDTGEPPRRRDYYHQRPA